eukprot:g36834.t1
MNLADTEDTQATPVVHAQAADSKSKQPSTEAEEEDGEEDGEESLEELEDQPEQDELAKACRQTCRHRPLVPHTCMCAYAQTWRGVA